MKTSEFENRCRQIRLVITDVDGVLTDGGMYYSEGGDELKKFNVRDGVGTALMQLGGLKVGAFTGEATQLVERRLRKIGVEFMFANAKGKDACMDRYLSESNHSACEVAYIGDEINDLCLVGKVGLFFAVSDANPAIKSKADYVLDSEGGRGVLREVARILLNAQGKLQQATQDYLAFSQRAGKTSEAVYVRFDKKFH